MKKQSQVVFVRTAVAASLLIAFSPARAVLPDEMTQLTKPESEITVGATSIGASNDRFGKFTGLREQGTYGQLDAQINRRDDADGVWLTITGRNLGREDAEFRLEQSRQGQWNYFVDVNRTPRYEPLDISTRNAFGTDTVTIPATGALSPVELRTVREKLAAGFGAQINEQIDVALRLQTEDKTGARYFGQTSHQFAPEPINSTTDQWEAKVGYTSERLQLSGGYYGSRYHNAFDKLGVVGGNATQPIALAPDNLSHQLFLSGGVQLDAKTRGTFKVSFTRALQDDPFFTAPTHPASVSRASLDGQVDTTLVNLGLTARPIDKLSLLANVRYEDRDDKTPRSQFVNAGTSRDGFNVPMSRKSLAAKLEAGYRLPKNYKVVGGLDYEEIERSYPPLRQSSWRAKNDELTARVEVRKSLSDTMNGAIKLARSERDGSAYLEAGSATDADVIAPVHWSDRTRDKVKVSLDWSPLDRLSVQFGAERSTDDYKQRDVGPNKGMAAIYSVDASYALTDDWQLSGWYTYDQLVAEGGSCEVSGTGAFCGSTAAGTAWRKWYSRLETKGHSVGIGAKGKLSAKLAVGADADASLVRSSYDITSGNTGGPGTAPTARPSLPKSNFRLASLRAYADYAYRADLSVRAQVQHQRSTTDDWLWTDGNGNPYFYGGTSFGAAANNTTVSQAGKEIVNVIGVSMTYKWW